MAQPHNIQPPMPLLLICAGTLAFFTSMLVVPHTPGFSASPPMRVGLQLQRTLWHVSREHTKEDPLPAPSAIFLYTQSAHRAHLNAIDLFFPLNQVDVPETLDEILPPWVAATHRGFYIAITVIPSDENVQIHHQRIAMLTNKLQKMGIAPQSIRDAIFVQRTSADAAHLEMRLVR